MLFLLSLAFCLIQIQLGKCFKVIKSSLKVQKIAEAPTNLPIKEVQNCNKE